MPNINGLNDDKIKLKLCSLQKNSTVPDTCVAAVFVNDVHGLKTSGHSDLSSPWFARANSTP